jgi:hypothetical protein
VKPQRSKRSIRREIFVLTPEEKRIIGFVLITFALGLATLHYRATHSRSPSKIAVNETATTAAPRAKKQADIKRTRQPK